jgi:hypothetical protein
MYDDRLQADQTPVTQDLLAMILGIRRSSISVSAGVCREMQLFRLCGETSAFYSSDAITDRKH